MGEGGYDAAVRRCEAEGMATMSDGVPERPQERFLRNHQENIGTMRAAAIRAEREGRRDDAERMRAIIAAWELIAEKAEGELRDGGA